MKNTCCVPNCESKRSGVKLHRFPKTDGGRKWVQCINSERLKKLSTKELLTMFVCHKHFELRFVTASSRLKNCAFPTLYTQEEMDTGIPSRAYENIDNTLDHGYSSAKPHSDHTYYNCQPLIELNQAQIRHSDYDKKNCTAPTSPIIINIDKEILLNYPKDIDFLNREEVAAQP
ncbi:hypothetical protein evm_004558 [Chilo suppressalis]|nr:hypothetical protein evm_004558 [Chilo suppressalis]